MYKIYIFFAYINKIMLKCLRKFSNDKKMKGISKPYLLQSPMATLKLDWVT
jgi:hypothetical protein